MNGTGYFFQGRAEMGEFLPRSYQRVLEIGCGAGEFVLLLNPGCETWGIEMNQQAASVAASRIENLLVGRYDELENELPDAYFDLVVCNDVMEHVVDHDAFLESVRRKMIPGAFLVASVPNVRHARNLFNLLVMRDWKYMDAGVLDRTHLRFFTLRSIRRSLSEHGFEIERLRGINRAMPPLANILAMLVAVGTLGYYSDIQYQQFGLCAVRT